MTETLERKVGSARPALPPKTRRRSPTRRSRIHTAVLTAGFVMVVVVSLFPLYWMLISALREPALIQRSNSLIPGPFSLENMQDLVNRTPFVTFLLNSFAVAAMVTIANLLIAPPVAYLLAKWKGRAQNAALFAVLLAYMLPEALLIIPIYVIAVRLHLDNTLPGIALALLAQALPLGIWLTYGFFRRLPFEVEEAALIDGASWIQVFRHIILPMSRPGLLSVGIFSFILGWADYLVPLTLIQQDDRQVLSVGLAALTGNLDSGWGIIMAFTLMICLPVVVGVGILGRHFVGGLTMGATKG